jgi:hypothetical protein
MANATDIWDVFMDLLISPCTREEVRAAFEKAGLRIQGGGGAVDAKPHQLVVLGAPDSEDSFFFAAVPTDAIDADMRAALEACDSEHVDVSTADANPGLWEGWCRLALATGARTREDLERAGDTIPFDDDAIAAITECWAPHTFTALRGTVDGKWLDRNIVGATLVFED